MRQVPGPDGKARAWWLVRCECGTERPMRSWSLRNGAASCGCQASAIKADLTGTRFGMLVVQEYAGASHWRCLCDCGQERRVALGALKHGTQVSCGCRTRGPRPPDWFKNRQQQGEATQHKPNTGSGRMGMDLTGQTFGKLTVLRESERRKLSDGRMARMWLCRCEGCGKESSKAQDSLRSGMTKSCGSAGCKESGWPKAKTQEKYVPVSGAPFMQKLQQLQAELAPPPPDPLERFRTVASALGHDPEALLLDFANQWLAPIVAAHGKKPVGATEVTALEWQAR